MPKPIILELEALRGRLLRALLAAQERVEAELASRQPPTYAQRQAELTGC
jgi:hypothetical protein